MSALKKSLDLAFLNISDDKKNSLFLNRCFIYVIIFFVTLVGVEKLDIHLAKLKYIETVALKMWAVAKI